MNIFEIASTAGLVIGPITAAIIAFKLQDRATMRSRQLDVFRTLMRTRRTPLSPEHVGALNLVEIDFAGHADVLQCHKMLFENFSKPASRLISEEHQPNDDDATRQKKDQAYGTRAYGERQHLLVKLLFSIGRALGYRIEQLDILEGGYHPTFHAELELQQELLRRYLISIANGERSFPVRVVEQ
jgi:hypothetical protein